MEQIFMSKAFASISRTRLQILQNQLHICSTSITVRILQPMDISVLQPLPPFISGLHDNWIEINACLCNCRSAAVCDTMCLQAMSRRIHYGKFVAEAKFLQSPAEYEAAIRQQDSRKLMELLTYESVEAAVKRRVEMKAKTFGRDIINPREEEAEPTYKVKPSLLVNLYDNWIMPLTKEVQVEYLLRRLD